MTRLVVPDLQAGALRVQVEPLLPSDFAAVMEWMSDPASNPVLGVHTLAQLFRAGTGLIGRLDGERVAASHVWNSPTGLGYIGPCLVRPSVRGLGIGQAMWRASIQVAGDVTLATMCPVPWMPVAMRDGFELRWSDVRMSGRVEARPVDRDGLVPLGEADFEELVRYDMAVSWLDRRQMLAGVGDNPYASGLVLLREGRIAGYGVVATCRSGFQIGPLMADTPAQALRLFDALSGLAGIGQTVFMDVPDCNPAAVELAQRRGLYAGRRLARMFRGSMPPIPFGRLFGVTTWVGY